MKNKTLAQVLRPIAAPQFQEQRKHIHAQFKKMLAHGMARETALSHAQFSVDSLTGNYAKISCQDLNKEIITLVRQCNGVTEIIAVCRPPKSGRGKATLEMTGSRKKRKFADVWAACRRLRQSIYRRYPDTYFSDATVLQAA